MIYPFISSNSLKICLATFNLQCIYAEVSKTVWTALYSRTIREN